MTASNEEERIDIGADVHSNDGDKVGTVSYVIVRPPEMHVDDIVVSTGALFGRDVVVPVSSVERIEDSAVYLSIDKEQLQQLPDYVDVEYQNPPENVVMGAGFYYPAQTVLWPTTGLYPQPTSVHVNAPRGDVGLYTGMDVVSSDGEKIGSISGLDTDVRSGDVLELIVKEGFLFTHDQRIASENIAKVESDRVTLKLSKDELQQRND